MIDGLLLRLTFPIVTREADALDGILQLLERNGNLEPTNASTDERRREPYDRAALVAAAPADPLAQTVELWRTRAPKYRGSLTLSEYDINTLSIEWGKGLRANHFAKLFEAATTLVDATRPELAFLHLVTKSGPDSAALNRGMKIGAHWLFQLGLANVYTRTWFGPYLTGLFTKERLLSVGDAEETSWGGVRLDLAREPWSQDIASLRARHREVLDNLQPTGLFGEYEGPPIRYRPGQSWVTPEWKLGKVIHGGRKT